MNDKPSSPARYGKRTTADEVAAGLNLSGKTFVVTGVNTGLGLHTMKVLSARGAHVIGSARTLDAATAACRSVAPGATPVACELSEPKAVAACAETILALRRPIDALICNAGIMALPQLVQKHGLELQFLVNHIGHFLLVNRLLPLLREAQGRIVLVSSRAHAWAPPGGIDFDNLDGENGYRRWPFYGQSKLANALFAKELSRRLDGSGVTANSLHPGDVPSTGLLRHLGALSLVGKAVGLLYGKSTPQGAATQCYVAAHPDTAGLSGHYFDDCRIARGSPLIEDAQLAQRLWDRSEAILGKLLA